MNILIFILGLSVGSFLNVLIDRLPKGQSIFGRSKCDHCNRKLVWRDLVPVFSFLWQKGRCRYCGRKISLYYPVVEIITGLMFVLIGDWQNILVTCYMLYVICTLIVIFFSDLKYFIIPDKIIYPAIGLALIFNGFNENFLNGLLGALIGGGFFLFLVLITRGKGMGWGDVKLSIFMGLLLGWPKIILALLLAFFSGALVGLGLVLSGRKTLKSEIPFATFLSIATLIVLFLGDGILGLT